MSHPIIPLQEECNHTPDSPASLQGEMAATAVNAPMMPPEVLAELRPYVALAAGLGRTAVQLVADTGFTDISITYDSPRGDDLDTRLLRAMVIKVPACCKLPQEVPMQPARMCPCSQQ